MRFFGVIVFGLLTMTYGFLFLTLGTWFSLFWAVVCLVAAVASVILTSVKKEITEKKTPYLAGIMGVALVVVLGSLFFRVSPFGTVGIYERKLQYADRHGYDTGHFPQSIPGDAKLTDMKMIPSVMQGDGFIHAYFQFDSKEALMELAEEAEQNAELGFTAKDYMYGNLSDEDKAYAKSRVRQISGWKDAEPCIEIEHSPSVSEYYDTHFVMIYIIDSNYYPNHVRTNSVVVDYTDGVIEYVGM